MRNLFACAGFLFGANEISWTHKLKGKNKLINNNNNNKKLKKLKKKQYFQCSNFSTKKLLKFNWEDSELIEIICN